ncbi:MAG: hypothetical protein HYZ92_03205 [Candidatus Omnitrophica bacterium]|nr:hypothetical protein [Candidatus Omnitrophota bacterium]
MAESEDRFHYCLVLERALEEFYGERTKWARAAGAFADVGNVREALTEAIDKIRKHLDCILTADERLRLLASLDLDALQRDVRSLSESNYSELEIMSGLLLLVAHLLGYDWYVGKPNRQVIYYQTAEQEALDDFKYDSTEYHQDMRSGLEHKKRVEIASMLHDQQLRVAQIARIMKLPEPVVKDLLVQAGRITRIHQTRDTR